MGKGRDRQASKTRYKTPDAADKKAEKAEAAAEAKMSAASAEYGVQVKETVTDRSFAPVGYVKSFTWIYPVALLLIMALMLYLRVIPSYDQVFTSWTGNYVNFASDDAVYHMRLVHETVSHFPDRIFYDPFTHYPFGSTVHFGPLFTLLIAGSALLVGLGSPSAALVDTIGAYMPAIIGVLCAVPTYFIGKKMFGRNVGIIAAFTLALLPGQFMGRSMLGFTDHHVAEVLFSVVTVAFLIFALEGARASSLNLEKIKSRDRGALKALGFGALAGFTFGLYMLTWPGGLIIGLIIFLYFAIQAVVDYVKGRELEYLLLLAAPTFLIPAVMVLPYSLTDLSFQLMYYSLTQPFFLGMALAGVGVVYLLSRVHKRSKAEAWTFPVALLGISVVGMVLLYFFAQQIFGLVMAGLQVFTPTGGMLVVGEAQPPTLDKLWGYFFWTFPFAIIALVLLTYRVLRDNRPGEWLFFIWNLIMLAATFSQDRFSYYFAVNAALLTAYLAHSVFRAFKWAQFTENWQKKVTNLDEARQFIRRNSDQALIFTALALVLILLITFPATALSTGGISYVLSNPGDMFNGVTEAYANSGVGMQWEWYETLLWMKRNTPDPQNTTASFSYHSGSYEKPAGGQAYAYPANAYSVMSWWDYGHMITYVAERIPNANPFQAGINEANNTGSAPFFLATSEDKGYANLQALGSRYVVIENRMANGFIGPMGTWAQDLEGWETYKDYQNQGQVISLPAVSEKYEQSMVNRLYHLDCSDMSHFRVVYESPGSYFVHVRWIDTASGMLLQDGFNAPQPPGWANYSEAYATYQLATNPVYATSDGSMVIYDARPPQKWVKVFEVVKGASITGQAAPGTTVTAALGLSTGERTFQYTQSAVADQNGQYTLIVPYATEEMKGADYTSAVRPTGKYNLVIGNTTATVDVSEHAVQNGETIRV